MDNAKLGKLIDAIVKQRVTEALKIERKKIVQETLKSARSIIKEEVKSQLIGILLEHNVDVTGKKKKTSQISELLGDRKPSYPKIQRREEQYQPQPVRHLVKDPVLNQILNATPYVADNGGGFTGNALMDSMGMGGMGGGDESMMYAQSIAQSMGKNVKIDINPDAVNSVRNNIPTNAQFITDKKTPHLKEYVGEDGFKYVDDRMLFENDHAQVAPSMVTANTVNLERALNKNYKQLLGKMDEKAQKFRNKPLNRIN